MYPGFALTTVWCLSVRFGVRDGWFRFRLNFFSLKTEIFAMSCYWTILSNDFVCDRLLYGFAFDYGRCLRLPIIFYGGYDYGYIRRKAWFTLDTRFCGADGTSTRNQLDARYRDKKAFTILRSDFIRCGFEYLRYWSIFAIMTTFFRWRIFAMPTCICDHDDILSMANACDADLFCDHDDIFFDDE